MFTAPALNGSSTSWTEIGSNLPNVQVMDVLLNSNGTLIATTHGRGIWTFPFSSSGSAPTTTIVIPSSGATLSGSSATLDASATNATSVGFVLFGGSFGFSGKLLCPATGTEFGWICTWNSTTVPNGSYTLTSRATNASGSVYSAGVSITVKN